MSNRMIIAAVERCDMCWYHKMVTADIQTGTYFPMVPVCTLKQCTVPADQLDKIPAFCPLPDVPDNIEQQLIEEAGYDPASNTLR